MTAVEDLAGERALSQLWERNYDPLTTRIVDGLPIEPDWRCLDVGAGAGSMSYWLAGRAHRGTVLAVDIDPRQLDETRAPNLKVRAMDITTADFAPRSFDLVLARAVFEFLSDPGELLARAISWLAPGGWLVMEDFYFLPSEDAPTPAGRELVRAYVTNLNAAGADMRWGRRLPATFARAGLSSVGVHVTPLGPGQSADDNELMRLRMTLQGHKLVENGLVSADRLAEFTESLDLPESRDLTTLEVSVWGQRAAE